MIVVGWRYETVVDTSIHYLAACMRLQLLVVYRHVDHSTLHGGRDIANRTSTVSSN